MTCNSTKVVKGNDSYGGSLVITPAEERHEFIYVTGSGEKPAVIDEIVELIGIEAVNGFKTPIPNDGIVLATIDCGGTLRCGIYPKKGVPTTSVVPAGKDDPLAQYISETICVSVVSPEQITLTSEEASTNTEGFTSRKTEFKYDASKKTIKQRAEQQNLVAKTDMGIGEAVVTLSQSAREDVQTMINTVIPLIVFVSSLIGVIRGSGIDEFLANIVAPLTGDIVGLTVISFTYSLLFLSPLLGPGAVTSQVINALIGMEIGKDNIPPQLALPALFAINTWNACDFVPADLGLKEVEAETVETRVPSTLYFRFLDSAPRVLVAWLVSFGLYS